MGSSYKILKTGKKHVTMSLYEIKIKAKESLINLFMSNPKDLEHAVCLKRRLISSA